MKRLPLCAVVLAGGLTLVACGSDGDDTNADPPSASAGQGSLTVSVESVDGVGEVLVDQDGMALYTADEEASGEVLCVDACESFWSPLEADGAPTAESGVAELDVIDRPDGTQQVTADGQPLYTFTQDSPGEVTGDGFSDDFGDQHFTWHVARPGGEADSQTDPPAGGGSASTTGEYDY